ncbi:MAG: hypothetical protein ACRDX8_02330 [Acidimicrobiales bacterium]
MPSLRRRTAVPAEDDNTRIVSYGQAHPDSSAGAWHGPAVGFVVAFTTDLEAHRSDLERLVLDPDRLQVVWVRYTYRQLEQVMDEIAPLVRDRAITAYGPEPRTNTVRVRVLAEHVEGVRARLERLYGDRVSVVEGGRFGWV